MPRGGARPGAGRPRKHPDEKEKPRTKREIATAAAAENKTPLEFMLGVMNNPAEDMKFRAAMAQAAAPYVHGKPGDEKKGKKEQQQEEANAISDRLRGVGPPTLRAVT